MPFVSTANNGGVPDPNIAKTGRPKKGDEKKLTRREIKDKELLALARKIKPHISAAITESAKIMTSKEATDQNKLKASAFLFTVYRDLIKEVYNSEGVDEDNNSSENNEEDSKPVFSLRMVND